MNHKSLLEILEKEFPHPPPKKAFMLLIKLLEEKIQTALASGANDDGGYAIKLQRLELLSLKEVFSKARHYPEIYSHFSFLKEKFIELYNQNRDARKLLLENGGVVKSRLELALKKLGLGSIQDTKKIHKQALAADYERMVKADGLPIELEISGPLIDYSIWEGLDSSPNERSLSASSKKKRIIEVLAKKYDFPSYEACRKSLVRLGIRGIPGGSSSECTA